MSTATPVTNTSSITALTRNTYVHASSTSTAHTDRGAHAVPWHRHSLSTLQDKRLRRLAHQGKSAGSLGSFMSSVTGEPKAPMYTNPLREDEEGEGGQPLDRHYLYLSEETIRQRYGTEE